MPEGKLDLVVRRVVPFERRSVFHAFSSAESMSRWFCAWPNGFSEVTCDFRVGGGFTIDMLGPNGEKVQHRGTYREILPGRRIVFTWSSPAVQDSLVHVELSDVEGGTEIELRHEFLPEEWKERHEAGWGTVLSNLAQVLESGDEGRIS